VKASDSGSDDVFASIVAWNPLHGNEARQEPFVAEIEH
jgi:hypothetical protein